MQNRRVGVSFYGVFALLGVAGYVVHEAAHWLAGAAMGYQMTVGLNHVTPTTPMTVADHILMSAAGPAVTILTALIAFVVVLRRQSLTAYAVLYFALFMRMVAAGVSVFNLNDEARISDLMGWGPWALPAVVGVLLLVPTVIASRVLRLSWKVNVLAYLVSSIVAATVVGLDMVMRGTL